MSTFLVQVIQSRKNGLELAVEQENVEANLVQKLLPRSKKLLTRTSLLMNTSPITAQSEAGVATEGVAQSQNKPCRMSCVERVTFRAGNVLKN